MSTLEELLALDGVVAAGEFGPDGSLVDFESHLDMSSGFATMAAQFCATVTMLFNTLARRSRYSVAWSGYRSKVGFYRGGDYTIVIGGYRGVFAETESRLERAVQCAGRK